MFKTILLDLDDTLLDFQKTEKETLKRALKELDVEPKPQILTRYNEINNSLWQQLEKGEVTRKQVQIRRFSILFSEFGIERSVESAREIYMSFLAEGYFLIDGALELLDKLSKEYDLYAVSNGAAKIQDKRLKGSGLSHYFKEIFISETVGYNKPNKKFFDYCFSRIENFSKNETLIVGDSLTSDIQGGNNAGVKTCWFNPNKKSCNIQVKIDYEIHSLLELPDLLKQISEDL